MHTYPGNFKFPVHVRIEEWHFLLVSLSEAENTITVEALWLFPDVRIDLVTPSGVLQKSLWVQVGSGEF